MSADYDKPFLRAMYFSLLWEGGFADVKGDKGGKTNRGITQGTYTQYLKEHNKQLKSVRFIDDKVSKQIYSDASKGVPFDLCEYVGTDEVLDIYFNKFWSPLQGVPDKTRIALVDWFITSGVWAIKHLQREVGVSDDGVIGPITKSAIRRYIYDNGEPTLIKKLLERRISFYESIARKPGQYKFLKGWKNRVESQKKYIAGLK